MHPIESTNKMNGKMESQRPNDIEDEKREMYHEDNNGRR